MEQETNGAVSTCLGPDGSAIGMPQLCFDWWPNQIFWLVVTLVVLYLVLSRIALPRIAGIIAERQGTISNDLAAAEELKAKANEAEEAYNRALAEARAESQRISAETKAEIQAELDAELARADAEIAARTAESEKAIAEIRATAVENVREVARATAAEIVLAFGGKADDAAVTEAVTRRMQG